MTAQTRYTRQVRLAEVGDAGQTRLSKATAHVEAIDLSGEVEARYLAGAGCGTIVVRSLAVSAAAREVNPELAVVMAPDGRAMDGTPLSSWVPELHDPVAKSFLMGAMRALERIRTALDLELHSKR